MSRSTIPSRRHERVDATARQQQSPGSDDSESDSASSDASMQDGDFDGMDEDVEEEEDGPMPDEMREISFGALVDAQESVGNGEHRRTDHDRHTRPSNEKLDVLRERIAELKRSKEGRNLSIKSPDPARQESRDRPEHRSSKHAPREISSKYQVTRRRAVVDLPNNPTNSRDPRFSSVSTAQAHVDPAKLKNAYSFLDDYRDSELGDLKTSLTAIKAKAKKRKSKQMLEHEAEEAEQLQRQINSIGNKKKSEAAMEKQREVIRKHMKEQRDLVKEGKNPHYLKRGEAKKLAEKERFEGLKGREKKKLLERREKRKSLKQRSGVEKFGAE